MVTAFMLEIARCERAVKPMWTRRGFGTREAFPLVVLAIRTLIKTKLGAAVSSR